MTKMYYNIVHDTTVKIGMMSIKINNNIYFLLNLNVLNFMHTLN